MDNKQYNAYLNRKTPNSPIVKNCIAAFSVGGGICCVGQGIGDLLKMWLHAEEVKLWLPICMVFLGALFTAIGVYDKLGKFAGGGSMENIPTTVMPKADFEGEGMGVVNLIRTLGLVPSNGEGFRTIEQGGLSVGGKKVEDKKLMITADMFEDGKLLIQKGKKKFHMVELG